MNKRKPADFFTHAQKVMPEENIRRAEVKANQEILNLRLSELRKNIGVNQSDVPGFSQTSISRIESRADLKLSTLIEYVHGLGLEIEIKARPKGKKRSPKEFLLLKS